MSSPESLSSHNHETEPVMDFNGALDYLKQEYIDNQNYQAESDEVGQPVDTKALSKLIQNARDNQPEAISQLLEFVTDERAKLADSSAEADVTKLNKLNQVQTALEMHNQEVESKALRESLYNVNHLSPEELDAARSRAEQEKARVADAARADIKKAYDNQVPNHLEFSNNQKELATLFGMSPDELLPGVRYSELLNNNRGNTIKAVYDLMNKTIEEGNTNQFAYQEFAKQRDNLLAAAQTRGNNYNTTSQLSSTDPVTIEKSSADYK